MKPKYPHDLQYEDMPVGMLISRIARTHLEKIRHSLESYGVQKTYGPILKELTIAEGKTQMELAKNMYITAPSMSVNLQKMEKAGFLLRKNDKADMRQHRLYLTEKGRTTAEKAEREIALSNKELLKALTKDEQRELRRLLIKIYSCQREEVQT